MTATNLQTGDLVTARGREWIVLGMSDGDLLRIRPLSGSEDDAQTIAPALEAEPVKPARFPPPNSSEPDTQDGAQNRTKHSRNGCSEQSRRQIRCR